MQMTIYIPILQETICSGKNVPTTQQHDAEEMLKHILETCGLEDILSSTTDTSIMCMTCKTVSHFFVHFK